MFTENLTTRNGLHMNTTELVQKLLRKYNISTIEEFLKAEIQPSDLQWFLVELFNNMVSKINAPSIQKRYDGNRFTRTCDVSPRDFAKLEKIAYEKLPSDYCPVELSPVMPFGVNAVLTNISQGNVLSTARTLEVAADTTMALALEAASRLSDVNQLQKPENINLCANQRCLRLQGATDDYGFTPHFKIMALCSAWKRQNKADPKIYEVLNQQLGLYLGMIDASRGEGFRIGQITVEVSNMKAIEEMIRANHLDRQKICSQINDSSFSVTDALPEKVCAKISCITTKEEDTLLRLAPSSVLQSFKELEQHVLNPIRASFPSVKFVLDLGRPAGLGYFKLYAESPNGKTFPLSDGGMSDWVGKLLSDSRWQLFTSGFGSEIFCRNFIQV